MVGWFPYDQPANQPARSWVAGWLYGSMPTTDQLAGWVAGWLYGSVPTTDQLPGWVAGWLYGSVPITKQPCADTKITTNSGACENRGLKLLWLVGGWFIHRLLGCLRLLES